MSITVSMERSKQPQESPEKRALRRLGLVLFLIYLCCLVYFLFFADWYDHAPGKHWEYHYNLVPFLEIRRFLTHRVHLGDRAVFLNLAGNVIGFIPFGFFLPVISRKFRRAWIAVGMGMLASFSVELIQLVTRTGCYDADDILLNTFGAALGYLLFLLCDRIGRRLYVR